VLKQRHTLWTCVRSAAVEPTHSTAERAIRPGVLWRKGRFESHSPEGCRFVEAMMSVVATLKQQHCHVLEYRTGACEAALCGQAAPSFSTSGPSHRVQASRLLTRLNR
jgi:transposase